MTIFLCQKDYSEGSQNYKSRLRKKAKLNMEKMGADFRADFKFYFLLFLN